MSMTEPTSSAQRLFETFTRPSGRLFYGLLWWGTQSQLSIVIVLGP